jgi:glycosyltransferase involved in cell wall biosynthesis
MTERFSGCCPPQRYRVLHLIDHFGPGGAQEGVLNLVKHADQQRFQVTVAAFHGWEPYGELYRSCGIKTYSFSPGFSKILLPLWVMQLNRLLRENNFHVVHCHLLGANLLGRTLAFLSGVPVIIGHVHCNDLQTYPKAVIWLDRQTLRFCHKIIAVSKSIVDFLVSQQKAAEEKIRVIYNAVDIARYARVDDPSRRLAIRRQLDLPEKAQVVLGVGRLCWQKNFPLFLRVAAALIPDFPSVYFVIAGEGPDREDLERQSRELGLGDRVKFLGYVRNLHEWYAASDVLFLPSRFEGTPMTVLEAMAMGLPIVASQVDGTKEILEHGVNAFLANAEDQDAFTQLLRNLLMDPELCTRLGRAALDKVRLFHDARLMVRQIEALYLQELESNLIFMQPNHYAIQGTLKKV